MVVVPRALRFIFFGFSSRQWLLYAKLRFIFPEPVLEKRFFALDLDFNLGISVVLILGVMRTSTLM